MNTQVHQPKAMTTLGILTLPRTAILPTSRVEAGMPGESTIIEAEKVQNASRIRGRRPKADGQAQILRDRGQADLGNDLRW